jgi:small-conductance mechanosensitive channel
MLTNAIAAFVIIIGAIWSVGYWAQRLSRARAEQAAHGPGRREAEQRIEELTEENAALKGQLGRLEARLAVLERIATDPAERTAREIEQLR